MAYANKEELGAKFENSKSRLKMSATDVAAYTGLRNTDKSEAYVGIEDRVSKAKSLGLFEDKLDFLHFLTANVDFKINDSSFKGKRGHQVRGGVVPVVNGLAVDFKPVVLRGAVEENSAHMEPGYTAQPQVKFLNSTGDSIMVDNIFSRVNPATAKLAEATLYLESESDGMLRYGNNSVLKYSGYKLDNHGLKFDKPQLVVLDIRKGGFVPNEVKTESAEINSEGLKVVTDTSMDENTIDSIEAPAETSTVDSIEAPAETSTVDSIEAPAEPSYIDSIEAPVDLNPQEKSNFGPVASTESTLLTSTQPKEISQTAPKIDDEESDEESLLEKIQEAVEFVKEVPEKVDEIKEVLGSGDKKGEEDKKEENSEEEREDEDEEISLEEYIRAFLEGDSDSVAYKRLNYARSVLRRYIETGNTEFEPDDDTKKELHLRSSEGDKEARRKVNGYEFGTSINILPWLYGFASFTPEYALEIHTDYRVKPKMEAKPIELAKKVAKQMRVGHLVKKKKGDAHKQEGLFVKKKEGEKVLETIIASVKLDTGVSLALVGNIAANAKLGLGVGNSTLLGVEGYIQGLLSLAGNIDENKIISLSANQEFTLDDLSKDENSLLTSNIFGESSVNAKIGLSLDAGVSVAARIRSKLLTIDYELYEFVNVMWNLFGLDFDATLKKVPGGRFHGFDIESQFSAEALGKKIKDSSDDGNFGFEFIKKNSELSKTIEVLSSNKEEADSLSLVLKNSKKYKKNPSIKTLEELHDKLLNAKVSVQDLIKSNRKALESLEKNKDYNDQVSKALLEVEKHQAIVDSMQKWSDEHEDETSSTKEGKSKAYAFYLGVNKGDKSLDKSVKKNLRREAIDSVISREALLNYEMAKEKEDEEESLKRISQLEGLISKHKIKNMDKINKDFTKDYLAAMGSIISNGITQELSLYADPEKIRAFEKEQIELDTKKHTDRLALLKKYMEEHKIEDLNSPNPKMADYYVKELKASALKSDLVSHAVDINGIIAYEEKHLTSSDELLKYYIAYQFLNLYNDKIKEAKDDGAKANEYREAMNAYFIQTFGESNIRKMAYRMYTGKELAEYEKTRASEKTDELKKRILSKDGQIDIDKLINLEGANVREVISDCISLEELLKLNDHLGEEFDEKSIEKRVIQYRHDALLKAINSKKDYKNANELNVFVKRIRKKYFDGEFDNEAYDKIKKDDKKAVKRVQIKSVIDEYMGKYHLGATELNRELTPSLLKNASDANAVKHQGRVSMIESLLAEGKSDLEIFRIYEETGAKKFKSDMAEEFKSKDLSKLEAGRMINYVEYLLREKTRASFFTNLKKRICNSFASLIGEGANEEIVKRFESEGHFGRWQRLVELRDDSEYKAMKPEEQKRRLLSLYRDELLGGNGLQKALESDYKHIMTPRVILEYEKERVDQISYRRNKRLDTLNGKVLGDDLSDYATLAKQDGEGIGETFRWLWGKITGNYKIDFDKNVNPDEILTPANILDYEHKKMDGNTKKHRQRRVMLENAVGLSDKEVFEMYKNMGGGAGFLNSKAAEITAAEQRIFKDKYANGQYSLEVIQGFEASKLDESKRRLNEGTSLKQELNKQLTMLKKLQKNLNEEFKRIDEWLKSKREMVASKKANATKKPAISQ